MHVNMFGFGLVLMSTSRIIVVISINLKRLVVIIIIDIMQYVNIITVSREVLQT